MSLLYYTFQSILNTFVFGYLFGGEKLIIFMDGWYFPPPPFTENSAKIINLIFEPLKKSLWGSGWWWLVETTAFVTVSSHKKSSKISTTLNKPFSSDRCTKTVNLPSPPTPHPPCLKRLNLLTQSSTKCIIINNKQAHIMAQ